MPIIDNKHYHYIRLTRLFYPEPKIEWEGWARMLIQRKPDSSIAILSPEVPIPWAEYTPLNMEPDGSYIAEDYMMEVLV